MDDLENLEELVLYKNEIDHITGLNKLHKLIFFSIGHNLIEDINEVSLNLFIISPHYFFSFNLFYWLVIAIFFFSEPPLLAADAIIFLNEILY